MLVHGLMGRGSTWSRQLPWLTRLGEVYTYDAPWHRGRDVDDPYPISTERFVSDLGDAVAALGRPAIMIGHSMGALHSWCLAATRPDLVSALVVEDMAPDFRGDRTATGWRLHGQTKIWIEIAAEWGTRDYWRQWKAVRVPALLIEAGNSVTPPGQMRKMNETGHRTTYLHVPGAGHLIHDEAPQIYSDAVESFLATLTQRA